MSICCLCTGMTFKWLLHNAPGYVGYMLGAMDKDRDQPTNNNWLNKMSLKRYVEMWPEAKQLVQMKRQKPNVPTVKGVY